MNQPDLNTAFPHQALNLYGEAELMAVLEQNRSQGLVADPEQAQAASVLGQLAAEVAQDPDLGGNPLANLDPGFRDHSEDARQKTTELFSPLGLEVPEFSELAEAGVNFERLQLTFTAMEESGLEPELVLAPMLPPDRWLELYQGLQDNPAINHDGRIKNGGLYLNEDIRKHWAELMDQQPHTDAHSLTNPDAVTWQVLVLPGTDKPPVLNVNHDGEENDEDSFRGHVPGQLQEAWDFDDLDFDADHLHPTIPAYLTLQARRLQTNEPPIDGETYTWLHGTFTENNTSQAPYGYWGPDDGRVDVNWSKVDYRDDSLGVRLPVWG